MKMGSQRLDVAIDKGGGVRVNFQKVGGFHAVWTVSEFLISRANVRQSLAEVGLLTLSTMAYSTLSSSSKIATLGGFGAMPWANRVICGDMSLCCFWQTMGRSLYMLLAGTMLTSP